VDDDDWLTAKQVCAMLQVGRNYPYVELRHLARKIPGRRGTRRGLRWRRGDILSLMEQSVKPVGLVA
jgi:hypothetical protein